MPKPAMTATEAAEVLKIKLPVTPNALKRAYHRLSLLTHPDVSKDPDAAAKFTRITDAYNALQGLRSSIDVYDITESEESLSHCDDGTPLSQCGQGLGPTTNGTSCPSCDSKGYQAMHQMEYEKCKHCREAHYPADHYWESLCTRCNEAGKFVAPTGRVMGDCHACKGTKWKPQMTDAPEISFFGFSQRQPSRRGRWRPSVRNICKPCNGRGLSHSKGRVRSYVKCHQCKGKGELAMWNPVLPKGLLGGR